MVMQWDNDLILCYVLLLFPNTQPHAKQREKRNRGGGEEGGGGGGVGGWLRNDTY